MNRSVEAIKAFKLGKSKNLYNFLTEADMIAANLVENNLATVGDKKYRIYLTGATGTGSVTLANGNVALLYSSQLTTTGEAAGILKFSTVANTLLHFLRIRKTSTTALNVQNDSSVDVFNVDTTNEVVTGSAISTSPTANKLAKRDSHGDLSGNILGSASTVWDRAITNTKMSVMPTKTIKGNKETSTGNVQDLTVSEVQTMIQDTTHRMVTDAQITQWNSSSAVIKYYSNQANAISDSSNIAIDNYIQTFGGTSINDGLGSIYRIEATLTDGFTIATGKHANRLAFNDNLYNATLTGIPTAPTATVGTSSTQIATTAFVNAMLGGNTVPAKNFSPSGYVKMANGLILQWGSTTSIEVSQNIVFPVAFNDACYSIVPSDAASASDNRNSVPINFTRTGFTLLRTGASGTVYWIAIGN